MSVNCESPQVSSSQDKVDRKPTIADLENAKVNLRQYEEKMIRQEKTIKELELQKKQVEEKSKALLHMAEQLKITNSQSKVCG